MNNSKKLDKKKASTSSRLFHFAKEVKGFLPWLAAMSFMSTVVIIGQMYLLSIIINEVFMLKKTPGNHLFFLLAATIIARAFLIWRRERFAQQQAVKIKSGIRLRLFGHLLAQSPSYARDQKTGELVNLLADGAEKLDDYYTKYIPAIVHIAVLPIAIIAFAFYIDWLSGLIMFVTAPLIMFFMYLIGTWAKNITNKQWTVMSTMSAHLLDALQGIKTLKIFNRNHDEAKAVAAVSNDFRIVTMKVLQVAFLSGMVLELAASISIALVAVQIGIRLIEGLMGYQLGLFILLLTPEFYLPFRSLGQHHHTGMEGASAAEKIFELMDVSDQKKVNDSNKTELFNNDITVDFQNVTFHYPNNEDAALQQVTCQIKPGELTAIVGRTGSGKTTFSHILMGFLIPSEGQVSFNQIPIENIDEDERNSSIAYVPQHPHFFNMSVLDNLLLANENASMEQVIDACTKAGAHGFIMQLPQAYQTQLTENAARLSGGEKQRLSIARAFLKNAPLLLLDEPTSNLDPESEELIARATDELVKNRTTLIIAHRLKTIYRADKILVLDKGKIAETGNHETLIAKKGIYASYIQTIENGGRK